MSPASSAAAAPPRPPGPDTLGRAVVGGSDGGPRTLATGPRAIDADRAAAGRAVTWLVRACHEVAAGVRPFPQLAPWLAPTVARRLGTQLRRQPTRPDPHLVVRRVLVSDPTPSGAFEATAVVEHGGRVRALAVRLERHHRRWRATELTAPDAGYPPLSTASCAEPDDTPDAFDLAAAEAAAQERLARAAAACAPELRDEGQVLTFSPRRSSA